MAYAYPGDEVYFHHKGQPKVGKVLCVGAHGCTVDHEGEQHKLKWEHIAGHKKRVPQNYKVLHNGEDGLIVENQHGHRRLLSVPPEARADQLQVEKPGKVMAKSMMPVAMAPQQHVRVIERLAPEVSVQGLAEVAQAFSGIADAIQNAAVVLASGQSVATDGMAAQLEKMSQMQAQMIEAIQTLSKTQPVIQVEPKIDVLVPEQAAPTVHVTVPEQAAPIVQVSVPEQAAPTVHVTVPEQPAPVVHVEPVVVPAPEVKVEPVIKVEPVVVPAPVVNVEPVVVPAPQITVEMPEPRRIVTEIHRDKDGNITGAVQKEA